jgi:hypothetical protein
MRALDAVETPLRLLTEQSFPSERERVYDILSNPQVNLHVYLLSLFKDKTWISGKRVSKGGW